MLLVDMVSAKARLFRSCRGNFRCGPWGVDLTVAPRNPRLDVPSGGMASGISSFPLSWEPKMT